jgi:small subunit ribosomal protein S7e
MSSKILKPAGSVPDELELQVAQNMLDLENSVPELKADLRVLQISSAKQVRFNNLINRLMLVMEKRQLLFLFLCLY